MKENIKTGKNWEAIYNMRLPLLVWAGFPSAICCPICWLLRTEWTIIPPITKITGNKLHLENSYVICWVEYLKGKLFTSVLLCTVLYVFFRKLLLNVLTIFAFTLPDLCLVLHVFVTSLAIIPRPGHTNYQFGRQRYGWKYVIVDLTSLDLARRLRLTSWPPLQTGRWRSPRCWRGSWRPGGW